MRAVAERVTPAGGTILKAPQRAMHFQGFHTYVADPAGFRWE